MNTRAFSVQWMSFQIKSDKATTAWYAITPTREGSCLIRIVLDLNLLSLVTSCDLEFGHWPTESETTRCYFRTSGYSYNLFLSFVFYYLFFPCYESEFDLITLNLHEYRDRRSDFFAWYWAYKFNYIFETVQDMYQLCNIKKLK